MALCRIQNVKRGNIRVVNYVVKNYLYHCVHVRIICDDGLQDDMKYIQMVEYIPDLKCVPFLGLLCVHRR